MLNDFVSTALQFFSGISTTKDGQSFLINDVEYQLRYHFDDEERKFILAILIADVRKSPRLLPINIEINQIGRIRSIEIRYPTALAKQAKLLLAILADQVKYAYLSFEGAFKSKFHEYESAIIRNLYERIEIELGRNNKEHLIKGFWLTLTKLSSNRKDHFLFFFDSSALEHILKVFKENQWNLYAPFEMLQCLLFEEAPDAGIEYFNQNINEIIIDFKKQLPFGKKNNKYLNSQKILVSDKAFGFTYISQKKDLLLAINYPKRFEPDFTAIIKDLSLELNQLFEDNLNSIKFNFSFYEKKKKHFEKVYSEGKDFLALVIAKAIKEFSDAA